MFSIDNNQVIRMSIGEDVEFPLFLNCGTHLEPVQYLIKYGDLDKVVFQLFNVNDRNPFFEKVFYTVSGIGNIGEVTTYLNKVQVDKRYKEFILTKSTDGEGHKSGDVQLYLTHEDTKDMEPGNYKYQIKLMIPASSDKEEQSNKNEYKHYTVTNKVDFYLVDDGFNRGIWEN